MLTDDRGEADILCIDGCCCCYTLPPQMAATPQSAAQLLLLLCSYLSVADNTFLKRGLNTLI